MSLIFKIDAGFLKWRVTWWLLLKIVDGPVNSRSSLFRINSVHQMATSLSQALLV
jgi:hypothetical protein